MRGRLPPYGAIRTPGDQGGRGGLRDSGRYVNPVACKGCGACVAVCPYGAIDVQGWEIAQYLAMVDAIVAESPSGLGSPERGEVVPA